MLNDLRFAFRMIATHRWFSAAVVATLALGIGINTTVFTLVNAVLFKPVPIPGGDRLVTVVHQSLTKANNTTSISLPDYREYKANTQSFEGFEALSGGQAVLSEQGSAPERFNMSRVTSGLFTMLRTPPVIGRGFSSENDKPGAEAVALIGYGVWQKRYGGTRDVIGRVVRLNGQPTTIIGVMPEGFRFPQREDVWVPLVPTDELEKRTNRALRIFGVRKPGISISAANADLAVIGTRLAKTFPDSNKDYGPLVRTFHDTYNGDKIRNVFLTMLGAVGFVLLIACANVANMMLSRAVARAREITVRAALGATRWPGPGDGRRSPVRFGNAGCRQALLDPIRHGLARVSLLRRRVRAQRYRVRPRPGAAGRPRRSQCRAEGRHAIGWQPARRQTHRHARRAAVCADGRAPRRRRDDGPQLLRRANDQLLRATGKPLCGPRPVARGQG
jgi:putative ABC transport system permease protein